MTPEAKQRLAVLQRFTELGAGFQVATHDLEIRGAGELLGERQHGAVAAVGFETYARILEEAVAELKGEPIKPEHDPEISVDVPAFIPDDYVPDTGPAARVLPAARPGARRGRRARDAGRAGRSLRPAARRGRAARRGDGRQDDRARAGRARLRAGADADRAVVRAPTRRSIPTKVTKLVSARGSRFKLTPDMRLAYNFDDAREARPHAGGARRACSSSGAWSPDGDGEPHDGRAARSEAARRAASSSPGRPA